MKEIIEKYALQNALRYKGKANPGAVMGSVIRELPNAKKDINRLKKLVAEVVGEVNKLTLEEQEARLKTLAPELLEKEKEEKDIFSGVAVEGEVVTAFPPEPSKYPHIGHAKSLLVNYEFAKRHKGRFILRFEDTNPEKAENEFYNAHLDAYEWLGVKPDLVVNASDHMEDFYRLAEKLIKKHLAYVDKSPLEEVRRSRLTGEPTKYRELGVEENLAAWEEMFNAEQGSMILRARIDLKHKNSAMRDPTLFRVVEAEHPLQRSKYRVWPTYDFENAVMDGLQGVTHRFRTKEFELRNELQRFLQRSLGFKETQTYEYARFSMEGVETSGRVIRERIAKGELLGWDDPSLATLAALKRRGFQPEAIKRFVLSTGLSKAESVLTWDDLVIHNRRVLDEEAKRLFFVQDPVKVTIKGAPKQAVKIDLWPGKNDRSRVFETLDEFYISRKDYESLEEGKLYRLMECLNFVKRGNLLKFHSLNYEEYRKEGAGIMHYLPVSPELEECSVLMPSKELVKGLAEPLVKRLKVGEVVQFERFGFSRLDAPKRFWYTHP